MADSDQPRDQRAVKQTAGNGETAKAGTRLALKDKILGCGQIPGGTGWGGARNRAGRASFHLTRRQCEGLLAAAEFSDAIKAPFNRHWTVHYQQAGIAETEAAHFIGRLLKLTRDYARRHGARFAAIWVRENGDGKGGHVHILLHLPARLSLRGRTRRWVRLAGGNCRLRVSHVRPVGGRLSAAESGSEHYAVNADRVCRYLLKGAAPPAGEALGLLTFGKGGGIIGKRCGSTQNIGRSARAAGNRWQP